MLVGTQIISGLLLGVQMLRLVMPFTVNKVDRQDTLDETFCKH